MCTYTGSNLVKVTVDGRGVYTTFTYDRDDRRTGVTDGNNNTTSFQYDAANRLTSQTSPELSYQYGYDNDNRQTSMTDGRGRVTNYTYWNSNRLQQEQFQGGGIFSYTYDANGNRTQVVDPTGTANFTYDLNNNISTQTDPTGLSTSYAYDADARMTGKTMSGGVGAFGYAYDTVNHLTSLTDPQGGITTIVYDEDGRETQRQLPNGVTVSQTWDSNNRLTGKTSSGSLFSSYEYTYNATARRTGAIESVSGIVSTYSYDNSWQLNQQQAGGSTQLSWSSLSADQWASLSEDGWADLTTDPVSYDIVTTYDAVGNPLVEVGADGSVTAYTYDSANRLQTINAYQP